MSLVILVPVLNRPHRVKPLLDSIRETVPDAETLFICSHGDEAEKQAIRAEGGVFIVESGGYAQKINAGWSFTRESLLFLGADDLRFVEGWYEEAKAHLTDGVQVVGVNDLLRRRREHATHFLVTREYAARGTIDEPGKLLHEGYNHWWIDDEFIATAKSRGAYAYAPHSIVEHLHPMGGNAPDDPTYRLGRSQVRQDRKHFARRQPLWT